MKNELKKEIAESLKQYLEHHGMSQNEFSKQAGVNAAYLVALNKGDDKVGETPIADKWYFIIAEKIGLKLEKKYWDVVATDQMKRILVTLTDAKQFGETNPIIGETGCGKTYIANMFADKYPLDSFYIKVSQSDTLGDLIDKTLDALKLPSAKSKSKRINDIVRHLRNLKHQGMNPMLMFDECEYMKQPTLCAMKEFYDNLQNIAAVVMLGTEQLMRNIEKMKRKNKDGIPQLYRRIKFSVRMLPSIDKSYKLFFDKMDIVDKSLQSFLCRNCDNYGELHDLLVPAMREADRLGEPLTENLIRKIINMPLV